MPRPTRFRFPLSIFCIAGSIMGWALLQPELDNNLKLWVLWLMPILALCLILLWVLFMSGVSLRAKGNVFIATAVLLGLFVVAFRVEGSVSGSGLPNFVWRWSSRQTADLPKRSTVPQPTHSSEVTVPQFLGPQRDGRFPAPSFSTAWDTSPPKQLWRQSIGKGWSAFCIAGSRAITQEQRGEEEWVTCYDLGSGTLLWHHADAAHFQEWQSGEGPRATPTLVDGVLYTLGATGWLNALRLEDGSVVWQQKLLADASHENLTWGLASSPLVHEGRVIVAGQGDKNGPALMAFNLKTGEPLWSAGKEPASYASPIVTTLLGKQVILANHAQHLAAHDPATGKVLFLHLWGSDKMPKCSQPVAVNDHQVLVSAGYQMGAELVEVKQDAAGKWTTQSMWQTKKLKTQFNSATQLGEHVYALDDGGLACILSATGERLWKEGRYGAGQHLLLGDVALIQAERGPVHLVKLSPSGPQQLATLPALSAKTWNYPTVAGKYLLVRNDREAAAYELPSAL